MSTDTLIREDLDLDRDTELGKGKATHIVKVPPGKNAAAYVLEARVMGSEVEALCGHKWIPQDNPAKYPICDACKEIYELHRMMNPWLNERPAE